jgi:DNA modification methylase
MRKAVGFAGARRRDGKMQTFGQDTNGNVREVANIRHRGSFWDYGMVGNGQDPSSSLGQPATFAEAFALDAVTVWSNPGDLVCDPFAGSGTVAVAARALGRRFVGAERVPLYHEIALRRQDPTHVSPERAAEPVGPLFGGT